MTTNAYRYSNDYSFAYNQKMDEKNYGNQTVEYWDTNIVPTIRPLSKI